MRSPPFALSRMWHKMEAPHFKTTIATSPRNYFPNERTEKFKDGLVFIKLSTKF